MSICCSTFDNFNILREGSKLSFIHKIPGPVFEQKLLTTFNLGFKSFVDWSKSKLAFQICFLNKNKSKEISFIKGSAYGVNVFK